MQGLSLVLLGLCLAEPAVEKLTATSSAPTGETTHPSMTLMVWTTPAGAQPVQVQFHQSFSPLWSTVETPPAGSIGLGTIDGTVGQARVGGATPAGGNNNNAASATDSAAAGTTTST